MADNSPLARLDELHQTTKDGGAESLLSPDQYAEWYALCQELRRLADYHERNLIRHLRFTEDYTWRDVAEAVQAGLSSKQAAHARWSRLLKPDRGKPAGTAAGKPTARPADEGLSS